jgi:hypothetical protein
MKGVLPWLVRCACRADTRYFSSGLAVRWACRAGTRDFSSALAALIGPVLNIYFLTVHHFNSFEPIAQNAGQAAVLGRLSLSMCLWFIPKPMPECFHLAIALIPHQL